MIEIVSAERCTGCNICVHACPNNVFEAVKGGIPRIARQDDCQTCFMCELYCPEDALFVAPSADAPLVVEEHAAQTQALLGSYRRSIGWGKDRQPTAGIDMSFELLNRAH
jgi:NAD-dependent dihydropyrimidine dehydrogenase PreA subunit